MYFFWNNLGFYNGHFFLPGMLFLAGVYSKDLILEMALLRYINSLGFQD
jgi:hypothetical protein